MTETGVRAWSNGDGDGRVEKTCSDGSSVAAVDAAEAPSPHRRQLRAKLTWAESNGV